MSWHVDDAGLEALAAGRIDAVQAASLEAHLAGCGACRRRLGSHVDGARLAVVWADVVDTVDRPRSSWMEVALRGIGVSERTARLVAATPSLRWSWLAGVALTLALCVGVANVSGARAPLLFLVVAPLLPLAAVAVAFAAAFDPTAELVRSTPVSTVRLLLARTIAVLAVTVPMVLVAEWLLDAPVPGSARWLLPSLALTATTLVLSMRFDPAHAAIGVGTCWVMPLVAVVVRAGVGGAGEAVAGFVGFAPLGQALSALVVLAGGVVVFARRDTVTIRGSW